MQNKVFFSFIFILNSIYGVEKNSEVISTERSIAMNTDDLMGYPPPPGLNKLWIKRGRFGFVAHKRSSIALAQEAARAAVEAVDKSDGYIDVTPS